MTNRSCSANYGLTLGQLASLNEMVALRGTFNPSEKGGRPRAISQEEMLLITLFWIKNNPTYDTLAEHFKKSRTVVFEATRLMINEIMEILESLDVAPIRDLSDPQNRFNLSKKLRGCCKIDATERPINRPKKNRACSILEKRKGIR